MTVLRITVFSLLAGLVLVGCDEPYALSAGDARIAAPLNTISIYQLAGRLDMKVSASSRSTATLKDSSNIVMVFADPSGQVYVNSDPVGSRGGIALVGDILFVPERTVSKIRLAMRSVQIPQYEPVAPTPTPIRTATPAPQLAVFRRVVVIDPGHGDNDPGATSILGTEEKRIVLDTSLAAARRLDDKVSSLVLTRSNDTFVELNDRAEIANRKQADLFVSVHADWAPNRDAKGYTIYIAHGASAESLALAKAISRQFDKLGIATRGIRRANWRVLVRTSCPAVLVELGYLSNTTEATRLNQRAYRHKLGGAIADGVLDYLKTH